MRAEFFKTGGQVGLAMHKKDGNPLTNGLSLIWRGLSMLKKLDAIHSLLGIWVRPGRNLRNKSLAMTV